VSFADLFAGSGAIALEAASRGAGDVTVVEENYQAVQVINSNMQRLGLVLSVVSADAYSWVPSTPVDIIYIDPPYADSDSQISHLVDKLSQCHHLSDTLFIVERGVRSGSPWGEIESTRLAETWDRAYGDSRLWYGHLVGGQQ
jgi:16S rRNA (guanine966-N2)-methyltransferase